MNDERLDQQIRAALEWQAERGARQAPTLHQSVDAVAYRLGSGHGVSGTRVSTRATTDRAMQLVLLALLIVTLLAVALAIGSDLLPKPGPPIQPGPFGLASECNADPPRDVLLSLESAAEQTHLLASGLLVHDRSEAGASRMSQIVGSAFVEQRLTQPGRDMVIGRVRDSGLTAGCRSVRTNAPAGSLTVALPDGTARLIWGPEAGVPIARASVAIDRERAITALLASLTSLEEWLPSDAWEEVNERPVTPERWLVIVVMMPTDYVPGDRLDLAEGPFIDGSDPRYEAVELPGAVEPLAFGTEQPLEGRLGTGTEERCGEIDAAAALAFAESLDSQQLGTDGFGDMFTTELAWAVAFELEPAYPPGRDCAARTAEWLARDQPPAQANPTGDLAGVDPCDLVTPSAERVVNSSDRSRVPSRLALGTSAWSCELNARTRDGFEIRAATLSLYPWTITVQEAATLVDEIFGADSEIHTAGVATTWSVPCRQPGFGCRQGVAAWSAGRFIVLEVDRFSTGPGENPATDELIRAVTEMVTRGG